jgi:hypothetical protein
MNETLFSVFKLITQLSGSQIYFWSIIYMCDRNVSLIRVKFWVILFIVFAMVLIIDSVITNKKIKSNERNV